MNRLPLIPKRATMLTLANASSALLVLVGCASTPAPIAKMAVAEAALKHASTTNTTENAPGELQIATAKLARARAAMDNEEYILAGQLAEQVEVDAQVAVLHAQSTRARKAAQESQDAARVLREEINRKTVR